MPSNTFVGEACSTEEKGWAGGGDAEELENATAKAAAASASVVPEGLLEEGTRDASVSDVEDPRATGSDPGRLETAKSESESSSDSSDLEVNAAEAAARVPACRGHYTKPAEATTAATVPEASAPSSLAGFWEEVIEADLAAAADAAPSLPEQGTGTPVAAERLSGGDFLSIATEESGK